MGNDTDDNLWSGCTHKLLIDEAFLATIIGVVLTSFRLIGTDKLEEAFGDSRYLSILPGMARLVENFSFYWTTSLPMLVCIFSLTTVAYSKHYYPIRAL